jgi:hypothetical protein
MDKETDFELVEDDILTACALRFDGWLYQEHTGFDQVPVIDRYLETGQWKELSTLEKLCVFFLLQRGLFKWDLIYQPKDGKLWRGFRELFLLVCKEEVPPRYELSGFSEQWKEKYEMRCDECMEMIRTIHNATKYKDI